MLPGNLLAAGKHSEAGKVVAATFFLTATQTTLKIKNEKVN